MTISTHHTLKLIPVSGLMNYALNSRKHSDQQIDQVANSIREFGFTAPILIDENNTIIAGHCRLAAAKRLMMPDVPCIVLSGLSELQKKAYVIADNKLTLNGEWDFALLKQELITLDEFNFNTDLTGFSVDEIATLFTPPEPPPIEKDLNEPMCLEGEIWLLGNHRLICGKENLNETDEIIKNWENSTNKKAVREQ